MSVSVRVGRVRGCVYAWVEGVMFYYYYFILFLLVFMEWEEEGEEEGDVRGLDR